MPKQARIKTTAGEIVIRFFPEVAPRHVANFCDLVSKGFYNGQIFHRCVKDFIIQGGCPRGDGTGGPGYAINAEFNSKKHLKGAVSMCRTRDINSAGSQFFIVLHKHADYLDYQYTVFGEVVSGLDVANKIANVGVQGDRPLHPLTMQILLEDGVSDSPT